MNKTIIAALITLAVLINNALAQTLHLVPLATFGPHGDGSLQPGDKSWLTVNTSPTERGMAYNPTTGHLLIVSRADQAVYVIDGATGGDIGTLDMSAIITGGNQSFLVNVLGVADDGAIFLGNLSNQVFPPQYNLYRWDNEAALQTVVFNGTLADVSNGDATDVAGYKRYGDTMSVKGAGLNTQVLIASRGTNAVILRPTDGTMTSFAPTTLLVDGPISGLGYGLAFSTNSSFYGTGGANSGGPLLRMTYSFGDGTNGTATTLLSSGSTVFPGTISALAVNNSSNLLAGVDTIPGADLVRIYDISNPATNPVFLDRKSFVTTNDNAQFAAALAFGTNGALYALDANNGIVAYTFVLSSDPVAPSVFLQPVDKITGPGVNIIFTSAADGTAPLSLQWVFNGTNKLNGATNSSLTISNVGLANAGAYTMVVTNVAGSATSSPALLSVNTLLVYEPFKYVPDGQTITNQSNWYLTSSGTSSDHAEEGNLVYPALEPSRTNRLTWGTANMSLRLPLGVSLTSGQIYYSFILRVDDIGAASITGDTLGGFSVPTAATFGAKLNLKTSGTGGFNLGTSRAGTSPIVFAPQEFTTNDQIFVVGRYTFVSGTANDIAEVWLNPNASDFGANTAPPATITNAVGTDQSTIDAFFVRASGTVPPKKTIDELRVGLTWASVTPPAALLSIAHSGNSNLISWQAAATGYSLQSATNLLSPTWTGITNPVVTSGATNTVTVTNSGAAFFRLIK